MAAASQEKAQQRGSQLRVQRSSAEQHAMNKNVAPQDDRIELVHARQRRNALQKRTDQLQRRLAVPQKPDLFFQQLAQIIRHALKIADHVRVERIAKTILQRGDPLR